MTARLTATAVSNIHREGQGSEWHGEKRLRSISFGVQGSISMRPRQRFTSCSSQFERLSHIVARQMSCHPAETAWVVLQWHGKYTWSRDEWSITNAELRARQKIRKPDRTLSVPCMAGAAQRSMKQSQRHAIHAGVRASGPRLDVDFQSSLSVGYLVDPASSHMLVSKIKPCMSKYELLAQ